MAYYKKIKGYKDHMNRNKTKGFEKTEVASVLKETIAQHY